MSSYAELLVDKFAGRGVLIDTNLLLLFAIGSYDKEIIDRGDFNRLSAYTLEDFNLLRGLMSLFRQCVTTAHVLSEVSNWIGYMPREQEIDCLKNFQKAFKAFVELQVDSLATSTHARFCFLGLTDTAMALVADQFLIVTDDARFVAHLNEMGLEALNINHLRQELWLRG